MADRVTEVTSRSWLDRIGGAIKGVVVGTVLFIAGFPFLFWNEGRAVTTFKTLQEGAGLVVTVPADAVEPGNDGKLVHLSGKADTQATVSDPVFGASAVAIKLRRQVEMYQWKETQKSETRKKLGGGEETVTTYTYSKTWSDDPIDSSRFKEPTGHQNPGALPYESQTWVASPVTLGAFTLSSALVNKMGDFTPLAADTNTLPATFQGKALPTAGGYYLPVRPVVAAPAPAVAAAPMAAPEYGAVEAAPAVPPQPAAPPAVTAAIPAVPEVGDTRVTFTAVRPGDVSVIARQVRNTFEAFQAKAGGTIEILQAGTHSAAAMFEKAQKDNVTLTWILRLVGFLMMLIGLNMVFKPLSVVADVVPFIGSLVGAGTGLVAFLLAAAFSVLTIAVAWIVFRPLLGIVLLVVAAGLIVGVPVLLKRAKGKPAPATAAG